MTADLESVLKSAKQNGHALQYAEPELKADGKFIIEAMKQNLRLIRYATPELRANSEFMQEVIKHIGCPPEDKADCELMLLGQHIPEPAA